MVKWDGRSTGLVLSMLKKYLQPPQFKNHDNLDKSYHFYHPIFPIFTALRPPIQQNVGRHRLVRN